MICVLWCIDVWLVEVCEGFVYVVLGVHDNYGSPFVSSFDGDVFVVCEGVDG